MFRLWTLLLISGHVVLSQPAGMGPRFDVASVKIAAPVHSSGGSRVRGAVIGGPGSADPERITWRSTILGNLVSHAYAVKSSRMVAPHWMMRYGEVDAEYDVQATMPPGTTTEQMNLMLQTLLQERFGLRVHWETRMRPAYVLHIGRTGPKLPPSAAVPSRLAVGPRPGGTQILARAVTMQQLASALEATAFAEEGASVIDGTGLTGTYEFTLQYAGPGASPDVPLPALVTALEQDLGLRVEKSEAPAEILIVDHAEKIPTEN